MYLVLLVLKLKSVLFIMHTSIINNLSGCTYTFKQADNFRFNETYAKTWWHHVTWIYEDNQIFYDLYSIGIQ